MGSDGAFVPGAPSTGRQCRIDLREVPNAIRDLVLMLGRAALLDCTVDIIRRAEHS